MKKKLMRSRRQHAIAGVCGGISEYLNIDVSVVRILWVISALFDGPGFWIYLLCALIIPKAPLDHEYYESEYDYDRKERSRVYMGIGFIGLGVFLVITKLIPAISFKFLWPIGLIVLGLVIYKRRQL